MPGNFLHNHYNFLLFQVVSYAKFLYPTNALVVRKADAYGAVPPCRASAPRSLPGSRYKPVTAKTIPAGTDIGKDSSQLCHHWCTQQKRQGFVWDNCRWSVLLGWRCCSSLVQCKWWALGLRLPQTPYSLHISGLVLFMPFKRHKAFPWEYKILYFSPRNIWCTWIQVVLLAF